VIGNLLRIFYKSVIVQNSLPANFDKNDLALFAKDEKIHLPESGLFVLKNVFATDLGIIYKNFEPLKENIICYDIDFKNYRFRYLLKSFLKFKKLSYKGNKCIIIFDNYSGPSGFAHWICDGLTRLVEINAALIDYTVIVPYYFKTENIYLESMQLFNVSAIHYLPKNSLTYFQELHFPTSIGDTGNFHPENVKKLRHLVKTKIDLTKLSIRNLYISRAKAKKRFVTNEQEVLNILWKYNFEIIYLEDYSFHEQIKLVNSAANIISIHGAALATLLFATEGSSVMELRSNSDSNNNMYYLLANVCKLNYYYLNCESTENSKTANNFDLQVPVSELEKTLQQMIFKKQTK